MEKWRLMIDSPKNAFMNMAIDEAILSEGISTLRLYKWKPSAISIGYFQSIEEEVNLHECRKQGVDVVRRITGGGAVYHDEHGEITYSVVCPQGLLPENILQSYKVICNSICHGLKFLGIEALHAGINDIIVNGRKISGSAQTRRYGRILQHGTILVRTDVKKMFSLLKVGKEKISDKEIKKVEERVTSLEKEIGKVDDNDVMNSIVRGFEEKMNIKFYEDGMNDNEVAVADILREKYESREWNFKR